MPDGQEQDAARPVLDPLPVDASVKRAAWDAFHKSQSPEEFRAYFDKAPIPQESKRALWDAKFGGATQAGSQSLQAGAIQSRKGGSVFANASEALKRQQENERIGAELGEHAGLGGAQGELGAGVVKGALSTGRWLGHLATKLPVVGPKLAQLDPNMATGEAPDALNAHGMLQKIGFAGEQAAEFAIPGGAEQKVIKGAETAIDAAKMAPVATKALKMAARMGTRAAGAGAVSAAQGGDVGTNAGIAALTEGAGPILKRGAQYVAEKTAPQIANKLLRPVPTLVEKAKKFGFNPGKAIADEGIVATSLDDLAQKITSKRSEVGEIIGNKLKAASKTSAPIDVTNAIEKPLYDAAQKVVKGEVEGGDAMLAKLNELRDTLVNERQVGGNGKLEVIGKKNLKLSPSETHVLKRQIGDNTDWATEDKMEQVVNDVRQEIYANLNDKIEKAVPGVKDDQMRYGNLLYAGKAASRELARHEARNPFSLTDFIAAVGTGASGMGATHDPLTSAGLGVGTAAGLRFLRSALAKTLEVQGAKNAPKVMSPEMLRTFRNLLFGGRSVMQQ